MRYRERRVRPPLDRFLECFWFLQGEGAPEGRPVQRIVPDGCPELIVHLGDPFQRITPGARPERQEPSFLVGQMTRCLLVRPGAHVDTFGVRFRPGGLAAFLAAPADELTDRFTPLPALWGRAALRLEERLGEASGDEERVRVAERFFLGLLAAGRASDPGLRAVVGEILDRRGQVELARLSGAAGLSERQLERRFRAAVGVAPKVLCRMVRFQEVLRRLEDQGPPSWVEVALDCGYFDQSHLIRDFRAFTGAAPSRYVGSETELARHFRSPRRLAAFFGG